MEKTVEYKFCLPDSVRYTSALSYDLFCSCLGFDNSTFYFLGYIFLAHYFELILIWVCRSKGYNELWCVAKNIYALGHQAYYYYDNFKVILLNSKTNSCATVNAFKNNVISETHLARQLLILETGKYTTASANVIIV